MLQGKSIERQEGITAKQKRQKTRPGNTCKGEESTNCPVGSRRCPSKDERKDRLKRSQQKAREVKKR